MTVRIQREDFDVGLELQALRHNKNNVGAIASFIGVVREFNVDSNIQAMELEHYPGMTEKTLTAITVEARDRWDLIDVVVIHRYGILKPTDQIVLVAVSSSHRGDAFSACEFIMDFLKTQAPFWKKELTDSGSRWVEAKDSDTAATERWSKISPPL